MHHIKSFNESKDFLTYNEILDGIREILWPLNDWGYDVTAELVKDYVYHIFVRILSYDDPRLVLTEEVEDDIDRMYEFTKENGFKIDKVYYKMVQPDGRVFNKGNREVASYNMFKSEMKSIVSEKKLAFLSFELKQMER